MEVTGGRLLQLLAAAEVLQQGGSTGGVSNLSCTLSNCHIAFVALSARGISARRELLECCKGEGRTMLLVRVQM